MKREWLLASATGLVTLMAGLALIRWLAPQLLGLPIDLRLVGVQQALPPFYDGVFRPSDYLSSDSILNDPVTVTRLRPRLPERGGTGPHDLLGFRNRSVPNVADVVVVGDSQTYGNNALLEQAWPKRLAARLGLDGSTVYSMAAGGWSAVQYLDMALKATTFQPQVLVVAFYTGNDPLEAFRVAYATDAAVPHWDGNVKRFELDFVLDGSGDPLDDDSDGIPNPPEILDVNGVAAVDPNTGFFKSTATSYWTPTADAPDGEETEKGGAASQLPDPPSTRNVYTNISTTIFDLANAANKLHEDTTAITEAVLGLSTGAVDPTRTELLQWSRGVDIADEDEDGSTTDGRRVLGAPLHARPLLVTYGGTSASPDLTLYTLTNDGYLHAVDPDDGTEVFTFVPKEHLDNLNILYNDSGAVSTLNYGLDGNFELWLEDHNDNGIIETPDSDSNNDHVYIYFGMRRGGTTYYALDVTDRTTPTVLWSITGGEGDTVTGTTGFNELADTWSDPQHHTIKVLSGGALVSKDVIVFGGGYDADQDNATNPTVDDEGRAIYIVDATTGALLWWAGKTGVAPTPGPNLELSAMDYSIPSQIRVLDVNTDGFADRMYVGDMGGQVWRFDIDNDSVTTLASRITGGVVATLQKAAATSTPTSTENRRFFVPPDVALVQVADGSDFLSLALGSGYRAHPLNTTVQDRFYTLFDYDIFDPPKDSDGDITYTAIQEDDLIDRTAIGATGSQTGGWYIQLKNVSTSVFEGEKVLASALTFGGKILFTTFTPIVIASSSSCAPSQGTAKLYFIDVVDADPIENLDELGGTTLTRADRSLTLVRSGIPPEVTILFPGLSAATDPVALVGAEKLSIDLEQTPVRTYWFQEQN